MKNNIFPTTCLDDIGALLYSEIFTILGVDDMI